MPSTNKDPRICAVRPRLMEYVERPLLSSSETVDHDLSLRAGEEPP